MGRIQRKILEECPRSVKEDHAFRRLEKDYQWQFKKQDNWTWENQGWGWIEIEWEWAFT